jgi:anti-sigma factor RsiW
MRYCETVSDILPQFVADGEPRTSEYAALQDHLAICAACQRYLQQLRCVEHGLRAYPPQAADASLTARIMAAIAEEPGLPVQAEDDDWRLLPLDVWLPAAALLLALTILALSIPEHLSSLVSRYTPQPEVLQRTVSLSQGLAPLQVGFGDPAFWALWIGLFVALAGVGLCVSLSAWGPNSSAGLAQLEVEVAAWMQRLREGMRRAS